jgi:hypothetical protein
VGGGAAAFCASVFFGAVFGEALEDLSFGEIAGGGSVATGVPQAVISGSTLRHT